MEIACIRPARAEWLRVECLSVQPTPRARFRRRGAPWVGKWLEELLDRPARNGAVRADAGDRDAGEEVAISALPICRICITRRAFL